MRIGEVAHRIAVSPKTIRYYESIGLIPEPERTESGYRDYREEDFERIRFVKTARRLDLSIDEIREVLAFTDREQAPCGHVRDVLTRKARELNERITEMIQLRDELLDIQRSVPDSLGNSHSLCPLIQHR
ncbi:MAG: heavy metal-responsive transcriptional regulator, partial [Acidimicrobiia bacterium]